MLKQKLPRRQRRLLKTVLVSLLVLVGISLLIFKRPTAERYVSDAAVEGITSDLERSIPSDHPQVVFTEVSAQGGIAFRHFFQQRSTQLPEDMGSGVAWGDYDNDGDDDLFVVNVSGAITLSQEEMRRSPATSKLYRNLGNGTFADVTGDAGLALRICGMGAAWGDFDADGWLDLVVTAYSRLFLFRNSRDGTFSDVSHSAGIGGFKGFWTGASWADYDNDGDLDLYVCGYVQYHLSEEDRNKVSLQFDAEVPFTINPSSYPAERNLLFRNEGTTRFTEVARLAGVENVSGRSLSAAWCDFDGDSWLDLYVANDISDNVLFRNLGNGEFEDISHAAWVADYRGAMGLAVGDWDQDGDFDIFVTHWIAQENALFKNMRIGSPGSKPGKMVFMDVADQEGLGQVSLDYVKWGTSFFDYDNDGHLDLLVVNGSTFQEPENQRKLIPMPHLLFWNKGALDGFFEVSKVSGQIFERATVGRGAAFADYDNDGDVDVFVVNHDGPGWLLRNDGGDRQRWLKVKLKGHRNRFGLGGVVKLVGENSIQVQQVGSQPSYLSQNSLVAHFGLGQTERVDLTVIFPGGGMVERKGVESNQTLIVEEP